MILRAVRSSNVAALGYDAERAELVVRFRNGATFRYAQVTPEQHAAFASAPSVGQHLNQQFVRNPSHPAQRVAQAEADTYTIEQENQPCQK